jgi:hypothetical protein
VVPLVWGIGARSARCYASSGLRPPFPLFAVLACSALAWSCGGNVLPGEKVDASTTVTEGGTTLKDAGAPDAPCTTIAARDYDQSCAVDTDCVEVGEVISCPPPPCALCTVSAINKSAAAQYNAILTSSLSTFNGAPCSCPCEGPAICRGGKCQAAESCGPNPADTLPACADAGGTCDYAAGTTCNLGPPGSCAFSDEICCL